MSKNSESLNRSLYDLLRGKGYKPKMLTTAGKASPVPEDASVFLFNFVKDGTDYGQVSVSIDGSKKLIVYYDDEVENSPSTNTSGTAVSDSWSSLVQHLSQWRFRNGLRSFELKNQDHLESDMAQREYMRKKESVTEGYHPLGKQASYNDNINNAKIIIQHSRKLEEGEQRYRNIARIFVENANGERFLLPTTKPGIAQVYARHIAEGGTPYDDKAQHINSLVEEHTKMAGFVRATRNGQFNESTQRLVQEGINHYQSLRECLSKMRTHRGYQAYFESWTPSLMEDELDESVNELFVQETMDPRIESVLPILSKLQKNISETTTMKEVDQLAEWADSLLEGGDGGEASEEEDIDTDGAAGEGTAEEVDDDENITEGMLDGSDEIDSPVANAITRRILLQRVDLLAKYGPEKVSQAIGDVAEFVGDVDEIGSSDVSGWIRQIERELGGELAEAEKPGLWANIHAKRKRIKNGSGEKMREPGSKGAPTAQNFKDAAKEGIEESLADDYEDMSDRELMRHAGMLGLEKNCVPDEEGGLANRREIIYLLQKEAEGDLDEGVVDTIKKGVKAVGKAIVGKDDDELLADLKKRAGVRNPENGKPSMAHSDVEKREELDEIDVDALNQMASHAVNTLGHGGAGLAAAATGAGIGGAIAGAGKKAIDWYQDRKEKKALEKQKGVAEDLDADQKRVGQLGPTEKVKNNNIGKLVGANESFINTDAQAVVSEMDKSEDKKGPEGKAKPITAKKAVSDAEKIMNKAHDKMMKSMSDADKVKKGFRNPNIKEGQEDLDAILRIIKK